MLYISSYTAWVIMYYCFKSHWDQLAQGCRKALRSWGPQRLNGITMHSKIQYLWRSYKMYGGGPLPLALHPLVLCPMCALSFIYKVVLKVVGYYRSGKVDLQFIVRTFSKNHAYMWVGDHFLLLALTLCMLLLMKCQPNTELTLALHLPFPPLN